MSIIEAYQLTFRLLFGGTRMAHVSYPLHEVHLGEDGPAACMPSTLPQEIELGQGIVKG